MQTETCSKLHPETDGKKFTTAFAACQPSWAFLYFQPRPTKILQYQLLLVLEERVVGV
jgi:hypothetical protein